MEIGDHVRFLDQEGGGTIVRKEGSKVIVQDNDGFDWTMSESQLVLVRRSKIDEMLLIDKKSNGTITNTVKSSKKNTSKTGGKGIQAKVVDLHQNALCYAASRMSSVEIHELQKLTIVSTLNQERSHHGTQIIFVHGKGEGVLRSELISILEKNNAFCTYEDASFQKYGYQGAIKVIIK